MSMAALIALLKLAAAAMWGSAPAQAQSPSGVPLPTRAGTTWQVVSGYNTATHVGGDPHALDLVRVDVDTTGSEVRSPVDGTVSFVSNDCLTVRDSLGNAHLLCHVFAVAGLARGVVVAEGDLLATVAPPFFANNGGLAHIHYAVHTSFGDGQITNSLPFTGQYALEGRNLFDGGLFNQYSGETFVSTNGGALAPGPVAEDDAVPTDDSEPAPLADFAVAPEEIRARVEAEPNYLVPGWNLVGWTSDAPVELATAAISGDFASLFTFNAATQLFASFAPGLPAELNGVDELEFGVGVWVLVENPQGTVWPRPEVESARQVSLVRGFNLVTWTAARMGIVEALAPIVAVVEAVYAWDPVQRSFRIHRADGPDFLNDLDELVPGEAIWVQMHNASVWRQG